MKPRSIQVGQTVGLIAPASPLDGREQIDIVIETVASLGFKVKPGRSLYARHGYLAGTDEERAADLNAMFADPEVDGIMVLRGGYGSSRLLPLVDFDVIRQHPKVICGYSDLTALLNGITQKTGLITFHGPIANQAFTPYSLAEFKKVLYSSTPDMLIGALPPFATGKGQVDRLNRITTLTPGKARGRLVGGNLTLLTHLIGTPYMPDLAGKILFLEDVNEAVYRIDRMLTQLWLGGYLAEIEGIVLGKFTDCGPSHSLVTGFTLMEVLRERCEMFGIPVVHGLMIGHVPDMTTVPIGCLAELDADNGLLKLLESPCINAETARR